MSKEEILNACLEFATKQSQPLSFFDSNGFKIICGPLFQGLGIPPISSRNIGELISTKYTEIKNNIISIAKNQLVSIKMDTATRHNRSVLGINLQIIIWKNISIHILKKPNYYYLLILKLL